MIDFPERGDVYEEIFAILFKESRTGDNIATEKNFNAQGSSRICLCFTDYSKNLSADLLACFKLDCHRAIKLYSSSTISCVSILRTTLEHTVTKRMYTFY